MLCWLAAIAGAPLSASFQVCCQLARPVDVDFVECHGHGDMARAPLHTYIYIHLHIYNIYICIHVYLFG